MAGGDNAGGSCSGVCGSPACEACPPENVVEIPAAAGTFLIDENEVSNADYALFLASHPSLGLAPQPACALNDSFEPGAVTAAGLLPEDVTNIVAVCDYWKQNDADAAKPVACVDWCDAMAYCTWAQKRLCGKFGGVEYDVTNGPGPHADVAVSEWFAACTGSPSKAFPYGDTYEATFCNDVNGGPERLDANPACEGGYPGLLNMSGNVGEWDNACTDYDNPPEDQNCLVRGGAFYKEDDVDHTDRRCDAFRDTPRFNMSDGIGFRCCSNPP